jgi:hypothetical protein
MLQSFLFYAPVVLYFVVLCALLYSQIWPPVKPKHFNTHRTKRKQSPRKKDIPKFKHTMQKESCSEITEETPVNSDSEDTNENKEH